MSRSSCRSATAAWPSRRSRSSAAAPRSWPWTCRPRRSPGSRCRRAATRTSPTSARSPRPSATSCSTSTTSTRRCRGPWEWDVKRLAASLHVVARERGFPRARSATRSCSTPCACYREHVDRVRRGCAPSTSGTTAPTCRRRGRALPEALPRPGRSATSRARCARTTSARWPRLTTDRRGTAALRRGPAARRAPRRSSNRTHGRRRAMVAELPRVAHRRAPLPLRPLPPGRRRPQGRRRGQRRHPVLGRALRGVAPADGRPTGSCSRSRRRSRRCSRRTSAPRRRGHQGRRVVAGQRLTQAASDLFLGWCEAPSGHHYYVRQLWDVKGQGDPTKMDLGKLTHYGALCARGARPRPRPHRRRRGHRRLPRTGAGVRPTRSPGSPRITRPRTSGITPPWSTPSRQVA